MTKNHNVIPFPNKYEIKKDKYIKIRDEVEKKLFKYAIGEKDLWAVSMAAGRFAAMNLQKMEGDKKSLEFFENCITTQKKSEKLSDS